MIGDIWDEPQPQKQLTGWKRIAMLPLVLLFAGLFYFFKKIGTIKQYLLMLLVFAGVVCWCLDQMKP